MRAWQVQEAWGIDQLRQIELPDPPAPKADQVMIRVLAASANFRDLTTITNRAPLGALPQVPFSDAVGEVIAVGRDVTRFKLGDRISPSFFPDWIDGPPGRLNRVRSPGAASMDGVLQQLLVLDQQGASAVPPHLSDAEAATLPCAALTAWRAVAVDGAVQQGETVVVLGTGGVSIMALQFAKMLGARVIVTSSSDEKLARARALGADATINYRSTAEWAREVSRLTDKAGADLIVEVGGAGTIVQSIAAAGIAGRIVLVGVLSGRRNELDVSSIYMKNLVLRGVTVGSRSHFEQMCAAIEKYAMHPVIDRTYNFNQVPQALRDMEQGSHFGKLAILFH